MKKLNKASKFFILMSVILALTVMLSCTAFGAEENVVIKNLGADSVEAYGEYRWNIEAINFVDKIDDLTAGDIKASWDVAATEGESAKAWLKLKSDASVQSEESGTTTVLPQDVRYELFIGAEGGVKAPEDMSYFFANYANLKAISGLENLDTSAVTNMTGMFSGCSSLESLSLVDLNTANVTDMSFMFRGCSSLKEIFLSSFNTEKVTHMAYMFADCVSLPQIYVDSFNTRIVRDAQYMFFNCQKLRTVYVGNDWLFLNIESSNCMFKNCYLIEGKMAYDPARTDASYASTEFYTVHVSILNGDPINLKVMDNLVSGQTKPVPEYIGYHYFNMIESFESSDPSVVYVNEKGEFVAANAGRATVTTKLKDGVNSESKITFTFSVEEAVVEAPSSMGMLGSFIDVIKGWLDSFMEKIKSLFSFSFLK